MKLKTIISIAALVGLCVSSLPVYAGNCDHSWQSAKDGSSCGDRAADRRPGGR